MSTEFNPIAELASLTEQQVKRRRKTYRPSKLTRFRAELVALRQAGASLTHLTLWLAKRRIRVARSTILRYLHSLPAFCHG